ncbi:hypothetical protein K443DRAFT_676107 [Laccaria amethystina LaAM-08-1]|uniref:Uncharacterized protein n=1 Tax=Laccaria amethystina LaAM-08-1 TaxID=1095629 RepID=A0A0C9Y7Y0_9AGAR|nr:hypothetical protein K443DRAFT_676107 [Laccaria amethystina LaAM-08-1]
MPIANTSDVGVRARKNAPLPPRECFQLSERLRVLRLGGAVCTLVSKQRKIKERVKGLLSRR